MKKDRSLKRRIKYLRYRLRLLDLVIRLKLFIKFSYYTRKSTY